ncbi:ABC transporter permease [Dyella sp.]|uniref:ABC transporter permease n=1 Tax=Dyella sp. TaxID=1869338 RepID=UPI002ED4CA05
MLGYYFQLGLRSLRRNPWLTALMVMAIGFGVAASMITYSVFRAVSGNPIPDKSGRLFVPQIDNWGPQHNRRGEPPDALTYTDAMALMRAGKAKAQTIMYDLTLSVIPGHEAGSLPFNADGYATTADFFNMFDVPFEYGSAWSRADDDHHADVAVIGSDLNQRLFGGGNSVGREINLRGHAYRIVGIVGAWNPQPRYFDLFSMFAVNGIGGSPQVFVPFEKAIDLKIDTGGRNSCGGGGSINVGWDGWLRSECVWVTGWVQLDTPADVQRYRQYLSDYALQLQQAGRLHWAPNVRLRNVQEWLDYQKVVPPESRISLAVALGFFVICLINTVGLLLAKFMRRAPEIGVRRALGASRREVYMQFLVEAGTVGLAGGLLGLVLTAVGMLGVGLIFQPQVASLAHLDLSLVALTVLVSVSATIVAAFYPTWKAAQVQPAWQLKSN